MMTTSNHTIDAAGRTIGRVASEAAKMLMGKTRADYTPNKPSDVKVVIENVSRLHITEKKRNQKEYTRYSGYPGGLRRERLSQLEARKPGAALRHAIERMLPRNTFRVQRLKNLTIKQ